MQFDQVSALKSLFTDLKAITQHGQFFNGKRSCRYAVLGTVFFEVKLMEVLKKEQQGVKHNM